jgi:hypothetical protein
MLYLCAVLVLGVVAFIVVQQRRFRGIPGPRCVVVMP